VLLVALSAAPAASTLPVGVRVYVRQLRRYAFAAAQDKSPVVGLTHASYALAMLDALEEVVGREQVSKIAGINVKRLRTFITKWQDTHAERLNRCDPYLQEILRIERSEGGAIPGFVVA
jgi:predicted ArsR family transcriptional regulator